MRVQLDVVFFPTSQHNMFIVYVCGIGEREREREKSCFLKPSRNDAV
jgi:hypothetical protein